MVTGFSLFRSQKSGIKVWVCWLLLGAPGSIRPASLPASDGSRQPWPSLAGSCTPPVSASWAREVLPARLPMAFVQGCSSEYSGPVLSRRDLILTDYTCKRCLSKEGHIRRFRGDVNIGGRGYSTPVQLPVAPTLKPLPSPDREPVQAAG